MKVHELLTMLSAHDPNLDVIVVVSNPLDRSEFAVVELAPDNLQIESGQMTCAIQIDSPI